ncbi:MAG: hypothetical protein HY751_06445 [Nitrospinae bacterium]|nr:hypothetical protein [Nitrospinota bacterium]
MHTSRTAPAAGAGLLATFIFLSSTFLITHDANALSQWARKYKTSCFTCHTAFPRLNYYGERFLWNGYQDPDNEQPDGDLMKKVINNELVLDDVTNLLGFRLNLTPFRLREKALNLGGDEKDQITIGGPDWIQFFVGGSIFKNAAFFMELEFAGETVHYNWWHLSYHNMFGTPAVNFQLGNVSALEFSAQTDRLRIFPNYSSPLYAVKTSNGTGDDSLGISQARPAIQYYGYAGPALWWAGVSSGKTAADVNDKMFYWGGLRYTVTEDMESAIEGSSVTLWAFQGEDGKNTAASDTVSASYLTSTSKRYQAAGNLRWRDIDVIGSYVWGDDEDGKLSTSANDKFEFKGYSFQAAWQINKMWYTGVMYDKVEKDTGSGFTVSDHQVIPQISFLPKENMRLGFYVKLDINDETGHTKKNDYWVNFRVMF